MKKLALSALALLTLTVTVGAVVEAEARPHHRHGHRHHRPHRHYPRVHTHSSVFVACAPEVVQGNLSATDRTLEAITKDVKFADATEFKANVSRIASIEDADQKATEYFKLLGIDAKDSAQVVEFVGARELKSNYFAELQRNAGLNAEQAQDVATKLQSALRGNLQ